MVQIIQIIIGHNRMKKKSCLERNDWKYQVFDNEFPAMFRQNTRGHPYGCREKIQLNLQSRNV